MVVFLETCAKLLTKSLCSSEDFLRGLSLTFGLGFRSYESFGLTGAREYVRLYAPIMAITVLAVLCLLGAGFYCTFSVSGFEKQVASPPAGIRLQIRQVVQVRQKVFRVMRFSPHCEEELK